MEKLLEIKINLPLIMVCLSALVANCGGPNMPVYRDKNKVNQKTGTIPGADVEKNNPGITFIDDIKPLIERKCVQCHGPGSSLGNWLDYEQAFLKKDVIRNRVFIKRDMPLGSSMTDQERVLIAQWVESGAARDDKQSLNVPPSPEPAPQPDPESETSEQPTSSPAREITYEDDIEPFINRNCIQCHGPGSSVGSWTDYQKTFAKKDVIRIRVFEKRDMPLGGTLTDQEREMVANWVDTGAKEKTTEQSTATPRPTPSSTGVDSVGYEEDIKQILEKKCNYCHSATGDLPSWTTYKTAYNFRFNILSRAVLHRDMPPEGTSPLRKEQRNLLQAWIESGSMRNRIK